MTSNINLNENHLKQYLNDGFIKIEKVFSQKEINEIILNFDLFSKNEAKNLFGKDINYVDESKLIINSVHKLQINPFFNEILHSDKMQSIALFFLQENPIPRKAEMFAKPAEKGMASPIHQDNFYWCLIPANALTIWIALDACNKQNGIITYMKGSHHLGLLPHINSYAPGSSQMVEKSSIPKNFEIISEKLNPGDILVHHSLTVHWSAANASGKSRKAMTLQFQGESAKVDSQMMQHYEKNLQLQVQMRELATVDSKKSRYYNDYRK